MLRARVSLQRAFSHHSLSLSLSSRRCLLHQRHVNTSSCRRAISTTTLCDTKRQEQQPSTLTSWGSIQTSLRTASSHTKSSAASSEVDLLLQHDSEATSNKPSTRRTTTTTASSSSWKQQGRRQRPKSLSKQVNLLTKEETLQLFDDELAPHLPLSTLRHVCALLRKRLAHENEGTTTSFRAKMSRLWHQEPNKTKIPPKWAQDVILRALVVGHQGSKKKKKRVVFDDDESLYPPHVNRENFKVKAHCLVEAREAMSLKPLLWSSGIHVTRRNDTTTQDPPYTVEEKRARYLAKSESELQYDAEKLLNHLADSLPIEDFKRILHWMEQMRDGTDMKRKRKHEKRTVMPLLGRCSRSHLHLIVDPLCDYFDVRDVSSSSLSHDKEVMRSAKQWAELRERFATNLPNFQQTVLKGNTNTKRSSSTKKAQEEEAIAQVELKLKPPAPLMQATAEDAPPTRKRQRRKHHLRLEAMFLQSPSSTEGADDDNSDAVPHDAAPHDAATASDNNTNTDFMVFLDNLPIDITEMELYDLYSRVGPISSLEIYNQRPELDPGPLSFAKLKERKAYHRRNRRRSGSGSNKKWIRPKTPVYALVSFATQEAYDTALSAPLRLFGMVVRKHAIRSTATLSTLYCENLPPGLHAHDLEYQLALALDYKWYVCLDLGTKKKRGGGDEPTSCEISFPNFASAYAAQDLVLASLMELKNNTNSTDGEEEEEEEGGVEEDQLAVNWFRTRPDANEYWTREMGFE